MHSKMIEVPSFVNDLGHLSFIENGNSIPFKIQRVYFITTVSPKTSRGQHGHKKLEQIFVAINGSFEISVLNKFENSRFVLDSPLKGLYVPPMSWREVYNFSSLHTTCLVLASEVYDSEDYIYIKSDFINHISN
jgi:uncharacterized RmlC-like cupin family protein